MIVELQRDADHVVALLMQQRGGHRTVDAARHRHDNTCRGRRLFEPETVHGAEYTRAVARCKAVLSLRRMPLEPILIA